MHVVTGSRSGDGSVITWQTVLQTRADLYADSRYATQCGW